MPWKGLRHAAGVEGGGLLRDLVVFGTLPYIPTEPEVQSINQRSNWLMKRERSPAVFGMLVTSWSPPSGCRGTVGGNAWPRSPSPSHQLSPETACGQSSNRPLTMLCREL